MSMPITQPVPATMEPRATFGWRPGSIRGLLSLMVLGLLWSVVLFSPELRSNLQVPLVYIYLQFLLVLIIAYYFPPHGSVSSRAKNDPRIIHLWPEIVPWLLVAGSLGLAAYFFYHPLHYHVDAEVPFIVPLVVLGGFFIGHAFTWMVSHLSGGRLPAAFQDIQAWLALLGMVALAAELLLHLFILQDPQRAEWREALAKWEGVLAGLVAFYYGARTETPRVSS